MDNAQAKTQLLTALNTAFPEVKDVADNVIGSTLVSEKVMSRTFNLKKLLQARGVRSETYDLHAQALQAMLMDKGFGCDAMFSDKVVVTIKMD